MSTASGGSKPAGDSGMVLVFLVPIAVYFAITMTWMSFHAQISAVYGYVRYVELWILFALGEYLPVPGLSHLHDVVVQVCGPKGLVAACARDFATVQWSELVSTSQLVNGVIVGLLVLNSIRCFMRADRTHPRFNFVRPHTVATFVKELRSRYAHLRLFEALELVDEPLDHPRYGMSLTAKQFAFRHRLIAGWREEGAVLIPVVDRPKATDVFRRQLGAPWRGANRLSPGELLLLAVAVPRAAVSDAGVDDTDYHAAIAESDRMRAWCWKAFGDVEQARSGKWPEFDREPALQLIAKYRDFKAIAPLFTKHAYVRTLIYALYIQARRLGVLQPAELRWLRLYDRELWYALDTIGRQVAFAESSAVLSHYLYEVKTGEALMQPQVDKAVSALESALGAFRFTATDRDNYKATP